MGKFQDLTGRKFNRLTVLKRVENKGRNVMWECKCSCNNPIHPIVSSANLKSGKVKSCGCLNREKTIERNKHPKKNEYFFYDDYVKGITKEGEEFFVDKEDFEKIESYYWHSHYVKRKANYVSCISNGKRLYIHRIIVDCFDKELVVDHIDGNPLNNRKNNLRICTKAENSRNLTAYDPELRGIVIRGKSYGVHINFKGETIWLGSFPSLEKAQKVRDDAELVYFGEFKHAPKEHKQFIICYEDKYEEITGETNILGKIKELKDNKIDFLVFNKEDELFKTSNQCLQSKN